MSSQLLALTRTAGNLSPAKADRNADKPARVLPLHVPQGRNDRSFPLALVTTPADPAEPYAGIRLTDVIGALSHALDMAEGQPVGHSVRTATIGMRIGRCVGITTPDESALFYALLLKDLGGSSSSSQLASIHRTDDRALKAARRMYDWTERSVFQQAFGPGRRGVRIAHAWRAVTGKRGISLIDRELAVTRGNRGAEIAAMLAMPAATCEALRSVEEHWDGHAAPAGLKGAAIPLLARIVNLAQTLEVFERSFNVSTAFEVVRARSGRWFDPELVAAVESFANDTPFWTMLRNTTTLDASNSLDQADRTVYADELRLDTVAEAFAKVIDAKSPFTARHSQNVSFLAMRTAVDLEMTSRERRALRRAALLHDIGKLGVASGILDKAGPLTEAEHAEMQRHTTYTYEILKGVPRFERFAMMAASHHERIDGSGYHQGLAADELSLSARVLAAADVCEALSADRPYRPALPIESVLRQLRQAATQRRLCPVAVETLATWFEGLPDKPVHLSSDGDSTSLWGV